VSGEKVLKHRVQDVVLFAIEFRVFVKGKIPGTADTLYRAQHVGSFAFQCLEFFAHISFRRSGILWPGSRRTTVLSYHAVDFFVACGRVAPEEFSFFSRAGRNLYGRWSHRTGFSAA
jgi:hypothetical protein